MGDARELRKVWQAVFAIGYATGPKRHMDQAVRHVQEGEKVKLWVPVIHYHMLEDEEECHRETFAPCMTLESAVKFWTERRKGVETMAEILGVKKFDVIVGTIGCDHENMTEDCDICDMWLTATLVEQIEKGDEDACTS